MASSPNRANGSASPRSTAPCRPSPTPHEIDSLRTESGESIYRRCSATHHHHLVCRNCGATVEVEGPVVEKWTRSVAAAHGYSDVSHTLEIFGTCNSC